MTFHINGNTKIVVDESLWHYQKAGKEKHLTYETLHTFNTGQETLMFLLSHFQRQFKHNPQKLVAIVKRFVVFAAKLEGKHP